MDGQRSKHLAEYRGQQFDYVVTVCDRAKESCPLFPGDPEQIHWSFPDPAAVAGAKEKRAAFERTATELTTRISHLLLLIDRQARA
jgi:protein-tyrosine-phosphatase